MTNTTVLAAQSADGEDRRYPGRIVVGFDGSPSAEQALRWATDETALRRGALEVAHCWLEAPAITPRAEVARDQASRALLQHAERMVDQGARTARCRGHQIPVTSAVVHGQPGPALVALAQSADLLVVGRRGFDHMDQFGVGSVSSYCLGHADCPVVVVPPVADPEGVHYG
jgi:nucleotide-binding universal stress UspA family protein